MIQTMKGIYSFLFCWLVCLVLDQRPILILRTVLEFLSNSTFQQYIMMLRLVKVLGILLCGEGCSFVVLVVFFVKGSK